MAKIHVGKARLSNRSLADALSMSKPGDQLLVHEGLHRVESFYLNGVHITGVGDPARVVIEATIHIHAESRISGVTLRSPHFHNLLSLTQAGARVDLTDVALHGDPARKYPAVYAEGGTVVMNTSAVHAASGDRGVVLTANSYLHAVSSELAGLHVDGGRAILADSRVHSINATGGTRLEGYGRLDVEPPEGHRWLVLAGESVCTAAAVRVHNPPCEAYCEDSFLQLDAVRAPDDESLLVLTRGHAVVEHGDADVTVRDVDAPAPPPEPKVVTWRLADARSFGTAVAPHLRTGDTVQLEEGEYFLEDCDNDTLTIGVSLVGAGRADQTVIHGSVVVAEGQSAALSHLTVRPTGERNALVNLTGERLSLTDVVVEPVGTAYPAVYLAGGTTTAQGCVVAAERDARAGVVVVTDDARLEAATTALGWLFVDGGTARLSRCAAFQVWADEGATITSRDDLRIEANRADQREIIVGDGSTVSLERVDTTATDLDGVVAASTLEIGWLATPEGGTARIQTTGAGQARVDGPAVTVEEQGVTGTTQSIATAAQPAGPDVTPDEDEGDVETDADPLESISALTGLDQVKQQIRSFTQMVRFNQLRAEQGKPTTGMTMHSLFLGNPGTGKTTVARLLGQALHRAGAIERDVFVEVGRRDLVGVNIGASAHLTTAVLEQARGGVLFIDEAYSLYQANNNEFAQEALDTILAYMENHRDEIVIIFAGYSDRMQDLLSMNPGLESRVTNRFDFEDYTPDEIAEIGYRDLLREDYTVSEDLYRRVVAGEYRRSKDQSNGRWVRNLNQALIQVLAQRVLSGRGDDLSHIADEDLHALVGGSAQDKEEGTRRLLEELDALVGLDPVKEWVRRLVNRVKVDQKRMERDGTLSRPTYHMVFAGNPGTGKTTVARIVAELFHTLGILRSPTVKEVDRSALVGSVIGQTEANTTKAVNEAMGGVLFVDEAYQLHVEDMERDFGRQAIETLVPRLENDREKFVAIFAGYSDDMDRFMGANPGLRSRVPERIEFPDYSPEEVGEIVVARLAGRWTFDEEHVARVATHAYAATAPEDRSNGRWARTFVERLEAEQNDHLATHDIGGADMDLIRPEVVDALAVPST